MANRLRVAGGVHEAGRAGEVCCIRCGFLDALARPRLALAGETPALHDPAAARTHLAAARSLVVAAAYHRRDGELAALEARLAEKR